jgi:prepilin-type N-terminal cleavage/methylation domain-containing protein
MRITFCDSVTGRQRGDTIVEVLIAVAVISLVLAGAYVATSRSLQATRSAQERSMAIKIGESQFELIKAQMSTPEGNKYFLEDMPVGEQFCMSPVTGEFVDDWDTDPMCLVGTDGLPAPSTTQPAYRLWITSLFPGCFNVRVTWDDVSGRQQSHFEMKYRVFE